MQEPDFDKCVSLYDTRGPYNSQVACLARLNEIKQTWPGVMSKALGGVPISIFWPSKTCVIPGVGT
jgi:hypothetical protein